mmetsp:Transcript_8731/g.31154  ORF Transcript_8731/g.31154 Transcript_8731/m.31154 type:complete len:293 (-) Transcript_8731:425-1303(-)
MVTFATTVRSASLPAALRSSSLQSSAPSSRMTSATKATRMTMMTAQVQDIITTHRVDVREPLLRERLLAEFVGTFFLVMTVGIGVASGSDMAPVAIGLMLAVEIYTFGSVSGGFLNPAVTLAVVLGGRQKISCRNAALYMVAECLGGIAAGFAALAGTEKSFCFDYAAKSQSWGTGFELEMLFTMALCGIVLSAGTSNDAPNQYFGFAIGCTVVAGARACGGFDQGSFNPAVTVGMNIANYANSNSTINPSFGAWFVFVFAPFVGAALAAAVFRGTRGNEFEVVVSEEVGKE